MTRKTRNILEEIEATATEKSDGYFKIHLYGNEFKQVAEKDIKVNGEVLKVPSVDSQKVEVRDFLLSVFDAGIKGFQRHERTSRKLSDKEKAKRILNKALEKENLSDIQREKIAEAISVFEGE